MKFNVHFFCLILCALSEIKAQGCHNYCCCFSCWILYSHMDCSLPSNHLILCHPSPSAFSLSWHQRLFQWDACFIFKNKMKINKIKAQPVKTVHINNRPREGMFYQITTVFNGELKGAASTHTNYCSWDSVNSFFICSIKRKRNVEIIGHSFSRKKDSNSAFLHPENSMWFHSITLVLLITFVTGAMVQRD